MKVTKPRSVHVCVSFSYNKDWNLVYPKAEITNRNALCKTNQAAVQNSNWKDSVVWVPTQQSNSTHLIYIQHFLYALFFLSTGLKFFRHSLYPKMKSGQKKPPHLTASAIFFICLLVPRTCKHFSTERYLCLKIGSLVPTSTSLLAGVYVWFGLQKK